MFARAKLGERAILLHPLFLDEDLAEFTELAKSAGAYPVHTINCNTQPNAKYFVGSGKLQQIQAAVTLYGAEIVLFNNVLSPSQERNLEKELQVRVVDRNGLILHIFALRARSFAGKLQVELAQLQHLSTRLIRGWTHLERQKGGIGMRGPGEAQLETDRRLLGNRIKQIKQRLQKVASQRQQGRQKRTKQAVRTVSLVGYTNAGKSTLFNLLTGSSSYAADQLFATLDPTLRRCQLATACEVVLADTVGFIRHLPHELIAAFQSTLQEVADADLLLHVIDASCDNFDATILQVNKVLEAIGADGVPQLLVFNKIDLIDEVSPHIAKGHNGKPTSIWLSAQSTGQRELLLGALSDIVTGNKLRKQCLLQPKQGKLRAELFRCARILDETYTHEGGWDLSIEIEAKDWAKVAANIENG